MEAAISCANCDAGCSGRGPFCGPNCKAFAEFVRLCRRWLRDPGKRADPNYPYVLQVRLAFLHSAYLGNGDVYDETARYLTTAQKAAIRNRDRGLCVRCGNPGAEVDHIEGHSGDPSNLQLLCLDCHHAKTRQSMSTITDAADRQAIRTMHAELANRVDSIMPIRACDNEQTWGTVWRSWPNVTAWAFAYDQPAADLRFADLLTVAGAAT